MVWRPVHERTNRGRHRCPSEVVRRRLRVTVTKLILDPQACKVPFVEPFCYGTREDEWVVAHCGPIKVHLFTRETRDQYQLELLYRSPEDFFQVGDFPHYVEIYGSAVEAMLNGGSHITTSLGSRSQTQIAAPYRDTLHTSLTQTDYAGAEEAHFTAAKTAPIDVGEVHPEAAWPNSWPELAPGEPEEDTDSDEEPLEPFARAEPEKKAKEAPAMRS
ncbi:unnamed protein product, partial [Effrenium voratum]